MLSSNVWRKIYSYIYQDPSFWRIGEVSRFFYSTKLGIYRDILRRNGMKDVVLAIENNGRLEIEKESDLTNDPEAKAVLDDKFSHLCFENADYSLTPICKVENDVVSCILHLLGDSILDGPHFRKRHGDQLDIFRLEVYADGNSLMSQAIFGKEICIRSLWFSTRLSRDLESSSLIRVNVL